MANILCADCYSAIKYTVSRLLLLLVSIGYGVVRPTLDVVTSKVCLLGIIYLMASGALELVEHLGNINDFSGKARLFLVLPVAVLDATFILWIFSSLSKTLEKLQVTGIVLHWTFIMFIKVQYNALACWITLDGTSQIAR